MNLDESAPKRELLFGRPLMIYQMPKVGSQTIEATLRQCSFPHPIYRVHSLSSEIAQTIEHGVSSSEPAEAWKHEARQQLKSMRSIRTCLRIRRFLRFCGFEVPKLEVITGVRELIGLVLASTFENFLYFAPSFECLTVERCSDALRHPKTFKALRNWFDLELKSFVGLDIYRTDFPQAAGCASYETRFARVLVYRFENFENLPAHLSKFLGWEIPSLTNCNLGDSKEYAKQYQFVKEHLRLPADFVTGLYNCKMMRHFYSAEERQHWHARWAEG
jgi:hypothetical protein